MPKSFPTTENGSWPGGRLQSQGKALGDRSRTPSEPSQGTSWAMPALPAPRGRQKIARGAGPWIRVSLAEEPCKGGTRSVVSPLQGSNLQPARDPGAHAPGYVLPLLRSWAVGFKTVRGEALQGTTGTSEFPGTSASLFLAPNWRAQGWPLAEGASGGENHLSNTPDEFRIRNSKFVIRNSSSSPHPSFPVEPKESQ